MDETDVDSHFYHNHDISESQYRVLSDSKGSKKNFLQSSFSNFAT